MGKKGKKSRRQAKKVDTDKIIIDNIRKRIYGLLEQSDKSVGKNLFSDAAANVRVAIQFLKTKNTVLRNVECGTQHLFIWVLECYGYLILVEDQRCDFEAVMEAYNDLKDILSNLGLEIGKDWSEKEDMCMKEIQLYYELALVTTKDSNSDTSYICEFLQRLVKNAPVDATSNNMNGNDKLLKRAGNVLRVAKKFDQVIDLDQKLLLLPNLQESFEVNISLAVSYIERYREEYHLRSKRDDYLLIKNVIECCPDEIEYSCNGNRINHLSFKLAMAQWNYLCHKLSDEKHKQLCDMLSILHLEQVIEREWYFKDKCSTCGQAPTKDDVKYVCSGCRVSCYCSIDHQRINWRKHKISGTCVGHKTFCPVLKAYRKWKAATNESTIDEERLGRMRRRFERECFDFLAYGLRLEKKCFGVEDTRSE